jgi:mannose-1-phosphate guanylyltransferase
VTALVSEAIMLVGGEGRRLRPLTLTTPKPLLPVGGAPILAHQLAQAKAAGIEHVVLATAYRSDAFHAFVGDGTELGLRVDYRFEPEPLGTAGAIRHAATALDDDDRPVLIFNGDIITSLDLSGFVQAHDADGADVSLHLTHVPDPRGFGIVTTNETGRVSRFVEKPTNGDHEGKHVNGATYVFERSVIDSIPAGRAHSIERDVFPRLLDDGAALLGFVSDCYWLDLGRPESLMRASADVVLGRMPSPLGGQCGEFRCLPGAIIAERVVLTGGTVIAEHARVEAGVHVHGSVIQAGARIGPGARIHDSIVGAGVSIGAGCRLDRAIIGDHARIGADNELAAGIRIWPSVRIPDGAIRFSGDGAGDDGPP